MQEKMFAHSNSSNVPGFGTMTVMNMRLKDIRKERGLTIDQLAAMTGLSRGFISQIETGKREPGPETLRQLAAAYGVDVADLFGGQRPNDLLALLDQLTPEEQAVLRTVVKGLIAQRQVPAKE